MSHTYDSLRELAKDAVTFASSEALQNLDILIDALLESGILATWPAESERGFIPNDAEITRRSQRKWALRWAMKAAYGASKVAHSWQQVWLTSLSGETDEHHRNWSNERIALRKMGVVFRGNMTRGEIDKALNPK